MEKVPMTTNGYKLLQNELKHLKTVERLNVINAIAEARLHGDLSENAEYDAAREGQEFIERRIAELEEKLSRAKVIDISKLSGNEITFGATVTVINEDTTEKRTYQIVGDDESDIHKGLLSIMSPLAQALIGKKVFDMVEVSTPGGDKGYAVQSISYSINA